MKPVYLKGLNGLRAIASMAVVISHTNIGLDRTFGTRIGLLDIANFGVTMFFTLSGFLITYLLLIEKDLTSSIAIKKFYIRRLLRIWPLYFLYLLLIVFFLRFSVTADIWYYLFFVPNIAFVIQSSIPLLAHYWSLGVEEQFYLFWPWVVKNTKKIKLFFACFIAGFLLFKLAVRIFFFQPELYSFLHYSRFGVMAIGGMGAYYYLYQKEKLAVLKTWPVHLLAWGMVLLVAFNKLHISSIIDHEIFGLATFVLIINQVDNNNSFISLENDMFDYLGKISFGIYVYNPLVIHFLVPLVAALSLDNRMIEFPLVYVSSTVAVVGVAHVSYYFFERKFLHTKNRFAVVQSHASQEKKQKDNR